MNAIVTPSSWSMLERQNFLCGDFSAVFFPDIPDNPDG
jgi:hypothetical protein